ncbi:MAG: hypothetical protein ACFCBW_15175 [Candidatus Competibacterales bacterium]
MSTRPVVHHRRPPRRGPAHGAGYCTGAVVARLAVGPTPRGLAVAGHGDRLLVTRLPSRSGHQHRQYPRLGGGDQEQRSHSGRGEGLSNTTDLRGRAGLAQRP